MSLQLGMYQIGIKALLYLSMSACHIVTIIVKHRCIYSGLFNFKVEQVRFEFGEPATLYGKWRGDSREGEGSTILRGCY